MFPQTTESRQVLSYTKARDMSRRGPHRAARALRELASTLLAACSLRRRLPFVTHPPSPTPHPLHSPSPSTAPGGPCREYAQAKYAKSWDTRVSLRQATSSFQPTPTCLFLHARAPARPYLSIAHCTPRPLRALSTSSFAAPLHSTTTTTSRPPLSCTP